MKQSINGSGKKLWVGFWGFFDPVPNPQGAWTMTSGDR